jgi:hypothetical protein
MDDSNDNSNSLVRWFQNLPESQRRIAPIAALAILLTGGWLATHRPSTAALIALPQSLTAAAAIAHLNERGINEVQAARGGKLSVPADKSADAKRFLEELAAVSTTWADEWERSNSQLGQFSGHRERDTAKEIARARMIGRLLRQMPGVAQADVVWDEDESTGWRGPQKTRCTVYLRPQPGYEITADVARSVRQAVAGSKKHLASEDIVVMDLDRMTTFDAVPDGVDDVSRTLAEREVVELRHQIEASLHDCPGARVNVSVNWKDRQPVDPVVELTPVTQRKPNQRPVVLASSNGFLEQLGREDEASGNFEPAYEVTVTCPEDAARQWAAQHAASTEFDPNDVKQAAFQQPIKAKASETIRQSVCSVLSKFDRRNLGKAVAVHLTPAAGLGAAVETLPEETVIDPLWFLAFAIGGCALGAWMISSAFGRADARQKPGFSDSSAD